MLQCAITQWSHLYTVPYPPVGEQYRGGFTGLMGTCIQVITHISMRYMDADRAATPILPHLSLPLPTSLPPPSSLFLSLSSLALSCFCTGLMPVMIVVPFKVLIIDPFLSASKVPSECMRCVCCVCCVCMSMCVCVCVCMVILVMLIGVSRAEISIQLSISVTVTA